MLKFTLVHLLLLTFFAAVAAAAITHPTELWATSLYTAMLLALMVAIVAALVSSGPRRAFFTGFAVFGATYFLLVSGPFAATVGEELLTTRSLKWVGAKLAAKNLVPELKPAEGEQPAEFWLDASDSATVQVWDVRTGQQLTAGTPGAAQQRFLRIGQSLWVFLWALVGGWAGSGLFAAAGRNRSAESQPPGVKASDSAEPAAAKTG
ncbi:MAG: hypothetical protein HYS13_25935 [Planctomycetia bacterium]|nr:hypothetical protein [Planctomycetia bacterium]